MQVRDDTLCCSAVHTFVCDPGVFFLAPVLLGQKAHQAMMSEIGTQIDQLQDRMELSLKEQSSEHQLQVSSLVASQDDKLADLESKLYSLGNGVADLEHASSAQMDEVRNEGITAPLLYYLTMYIEKAHFAGV